MGNRQLKDAFDALHANEALADQVLASASSAKTPRKSGKAKPLALVATGTLAVVLATSGIAYAAVSSNFFGWAWGDHGHGQRQEWSVEHDDGSAVSLTREYGDETAPTDLAEAVEHVGMAVEGNGYTLDLGDIAIDENGCGSATFTLSNPNGVELYGPAAETGELVVSGAQGSQVLDSIQMSAGENDYADTREVIETGTSTDTEVRGTMYFAFSGGTEHLNEGITWTLWWHEPGTDAGEDQQNRSSTGQAFYPSKRVAARTLQIADGHEASVSPFSVRVSASMAEADRISRVSLTLADGTERIIKDDESGILNNYFGLIRGDGLVMVATQLIDPEQVAAINLEYRS